MGAASGGTYGMVEPIDWLADDSRALLLARERGEVDGRTHEWVRAILFTITSGVMARVQLMEDDQRGYDAWLGGDSDDSGADRPGQADPDGRPRMTGRLDDPRVQAVMAYQQNVASGRVDEARTVFWDDVRTVCPVSPCSRASTRGPTP